MRSVILYHSGLLTNPDVSDKQNDLCGARRPLMELAALTHSNLDVVAWDDPAAPGYLEAELKRYDFVVGIGHSHGAFRASDSASRLAADTVDVLCLIDDCPYGKPFSWMMPPRVPPVAARSGTALWQRNSQPSGVAYQERLGWSSYDVSGWTGPKLGHIDMPPLGLSSIAGDSRTWDIIRECVMSSFLRKNVNT